MAKIIAPLPFSGIRANLVFVNGESDTNDAWLIQWFKEHGYEVIDKPDEPEVEDEGGGGIADMTVKELKAYAADKGITLGTAKTKADIIAVIEAAEADSDEEVEEAEDEGDDSDAEVEDEGGEGEND